MRSTLRGRRLSADLAAVVTHCLQVQEYASIGITLDLHSLGLFPREGDLYRV